MLSRIHNGPGRGTPPTGTVGIAVWAVILCLGMFSGGPAAAARDERVIQRRPLGSGLVAEVTAGGELRLLNPAADEALLTAVLEVPRPGGRARTATAAPHVGRTVEGAAGGQRGFSAQADDDGDGRLDEDLLDGRDNDGDGLTDEDYAAISDAMLTVEQAAGGARLEFYHWSYNHLRNIVFASVTAGAMGTGQWVLTTTGASWQEASVGGTRHVAGGYTRQLQTHAFVSRLPGSRPGAAGRWLGVVVLDQPGAGGVGRGALKGRDLGVRLGTDPLAVAVCAADSWSGLVHMLTEAQLVRDGVADPVSGQRVPWVAAPVCASCRQAEHPSWGWRTDNQGHLHLQATIGPNTCSRLDPDLFVVGDEALGAPDQILWTPTEGPEVGVAWFDATTSRLSHAGQGPSDPYATLKGAAGHDAEGLLTFRYRTPDTSVLAALTGDHAGIDAAQTITGRYLDGRSATMPLRADMPTTDPVRSAMVLARAGLEADPPPGDQERALRTARTRPTLSPELLEGWPNPFRSTINLRFRIPATMGEAFTWERTADTPTQIDLAAPVPWSGGDPLVSLRIYSISGQELATLHEGFVASGEVAVSWSGRDAFGRKVASGTYFCKLQMDEWSVTRRIVFVR